MPDTTKKYDKSTTGSILGLSNDTFKDLIHAATLYDRESIEWYDKFNRFGCIDPHNALQNTREYIFITKPDLHIFNDGDHTLLNPEIENAPIFVDALRRYNKVLQQLQYSTKGNGSPFANLLSNSITNNLELPGISASSDIETSENIYGTKMFYRKASFSSDEDFEFNLEFEDTKYLEVYMFFKLYDEYERRKYYGTVTPPNDTYRKFKILHDQMAMYKFIVGEDGETIIYYAKLYGCYPKGVPRDTFSDLPAAGRLSFTVPFKATFVEDMEPTILSDFNILAGPLYSVRSKANDNKDLPIYNEDLGTVDGTWATVPYITATEGINGTLSYKLKWR